MKMGAGEQHIEPLPRNRSKSTKIRLTKTSIKALEAPVES